MKKKIVFIINPKAGKRKGGRHKRKIEKEFGDSVLVFTTSEQGANSAFSLAQKAVHDGVSIVVSVGGDGNHNLVVNGLMAGIKEKGLSCDNLPELGLIGTGTGNNLTKNLGIQFGIAKALNTIKGGNCRAVDLGLLFAGNEKKYFVNVVSFGFDGLVVATLKNLKERCKFLPKDLAYLIAAGWRIFLGLPLYDFSLSGPDFNIKTKAHLLALLNGPTYGAIFKMAPGADSCDGLFNACLVNRSNRIKAVELLFRAIWGKHTGSSRVKSFKFSSLVVSAAKPLPCEMDGEVVPEEKEYTISVLPGALKILVPPT